MTVVASSRWPKRAKADVHALSRGVHTLLPQAVHALNKLTSAVRKEMNALGFCEVLMPCAVRASAFDRRLRAMGDAFIKASNDMVLAPTAEDVVVAMPSACAPTKLYQVQLKFRLEPRPSHGLVRSYEFVMKDGYVVSATRRGALNELKAVMGSYVRVLRGVGIEVAPCVASAKDIGGSHSLELVAVGLGRVGGAKYYVPARSLASASWSAR